MLEALSEWMNHQVLGLRLASLVGAFTFIFAGYIAKRICVSIFDRLLRIADTTRTQLDDIFLKAAGPPLGNILLLGGFWAGVALLPMPDEPKQLAILIDSFFRAATIFMVIWFAVRITDATGAHWEENAPEERQWIHDIAPLFRKSSRVFLWILGGLLILQNLGYSVSALMAGLGIGGAAIAFASKDTIANLFGSIVVLVDRPFRIGDWVEIDSQEGTVEDIGLRVTRIRTFANSLITMPNAKLTNTVINNWSRMKKRRIKTTIGITYDASPEKMAQAVEAIRRVLREDDRIRQDFFLVNFTEFGASSLDIMVYCFTTTTNWAEYLQVRQEVFLKFMQALADLGLAFAFPTRTVHHQAAPGDLNVSFDHDPLG